jgi:hypothetical protein
MKGLAYYYTRDHLGSIREVTDINGNVVVRYDYDAYGRVTLIQGTNIAAFQYAGYYEHAPSWTARRLCRGLTIFLSSPLPAPGF